MSPEQREWTGPVTTRLRCCVCGDDTEGADDYVVLALTAAPSDAIQYLGAHAGHLNGALAAGFHLDGYPEDDR
ncbi:hypothetical protein ACIA5C_47285 [Actinoplanes sp. NPDC051343]|jgi:hypothetical protein|uniref:hypothetical protein n=1 Tax=Actinoplanes sp. NPDC051343 TaxID=3363906 RepID=UPI0037B1F53A